MRCWGRSDEPCRRTVLPRLMIVSAVVWHVLLLIFAQMHTLPGGIVMLLLCGIFQSLAMVSHTVILLQHVEPALPWPCHGRDACWRSTACRSAS